jgi:uncharacterized protein
MNRVIVGVLAMVVGSVGIVHTAFAYTSPGVSVGFVNDFAGVLSEQTESALNETLTAFSASTTNEVVVVTVPTIGDEYIEQYAVKLFEEWAWGKYREKRRKVKKYVENLTDIIKYVNILLSF